MKQTKFKINSSDINIEFIIDGKPRLDQLRDIIVRYALLIGYTPTQIETEFGKIENKYQQDYNKLTLLD
jgi:hypothetical protein